jgi:hypothetical protein
VCVRKIPRQFACPSHHSDTPEQRVQEMSVSGRFHLVWCPRTDTHLNYMIDIALTTEFFRCC